MRSYIIILFLLFPFLLKGQFVDNFSDGDFTANPVWAGNTADWTITAGQLNSNGPAVTTTIIYLSTPSTISSNAVWEFFANPKLATSSGNFMDVYLMSDSANLTTAKNGYFVRLGNTSDDVSLYQLQNGTSSIIIDGTNGTLASASNNPTKVKVSRTSSNVWSLEADFTGVGNNFVLQGTANNAVINSSSFFGVKANYSSANFNKYFFDDFNVAQLTVDLTPPALLSAIPISANQLDVLFNETVDTTSSKDTAHYFVNNGIGYPLTAARDAANLSLVHLSFATSFTSGQVDSLFVDSIADVSANLLLADTATFTYTAIFVAGYKDVIINEIMADPTPVVGLPNAEFLEIFNRSANPINLNQWSFTDNPSTNPANMGNYILQPDSFLIVCASSSLPLFSSFPNVMGVASFPSLVNTGNQIYLKSNSGVFIDSVDYSDTWYKDIAKAQGGWTLELINPDANINCAVNSNWIAANSASGGTPGVQNSVYSNVPDLTPPSVLSITAINSTQVSICFNEAIDISKIGLAGNYSINNGIGNPSATNPYNSFSCVTLTLSTAFVSQQVNTITFANLSDCSGNVLSPNTATFTYFAPVVTSPKDIVINEIYSSPSASSGLPNAEYVELFNRSGSAINIKDWSFYDSPLLSAPNIPNFVLLPDSFVVLCASSNVALFAGIGNVLGISSFPTLNNTGDNLYLRNELQTLIDSVPYTDDWYRDAVKKQGGWSLELINPNQSITCAPAANWIASTNPAGGTPGKQNTVFSNAPDLTAPSIINAFAVDSIHITLCFSEAIDAALIGVLSNYTVNGGIGNPLSLAPNLSLSCVDLTLANPLISQQVYTITLTNLADCSGNLVNPNTVNFVYYAPVIAKKKQVILTEIYSSPTSTSGLPLTEYLEIKNRSNVPINIGGWSIQDDTAGTVNIGNFILFPDSFLILCPLANINLFAANVKVLGLASFPSLNNTGDHIYLKNNLGSIVDDVNYSDTWYRNNTKKAGGWSLELIDPDFACNNTLNWIASTNASGGTPGKPNSVNGTFTDNQAPGLLRAIVTSSTSIKLFFDEPVNYSALVNINSYSFSDGIVLPPGTGFVVNTDSTQVNIALPITMQLKTIYTVTVNAKIADCAGNSIGDYNSAQFGLWEEPEYNDVVVNEILFDPVSGGTDYVELYNRSTKVIDLSQLILSAKDTITGELKSQYTISPSPESFMLLPGQYLVLSENTAVVKQLYVTTNPRGFWQMENIPSFNISDGTVVLSTPQQKIIDDLHYYDSWQFPLLVSTKGVALERIDYNRSTQDASNWHSASQNVGFGTPAYRNSQYSENASSANDEVSIDPEVFSPDNDGFQDVINITYKTDIPGYTGSITVFDARGRLIRNLVKNELWGNTGTYSWDGITNDNDKARIGIYVFLVEVFDLNGNTRQYKKTCVLGAKL